MCVCVCACACISVYVYAMRVHTMHMYTNMPKDGSEVCVHVQVHVRVYIYIYTHVNVYAYLHVHVLVYVYVMYMYMRSAHECMCLCTCSCLINCRLLIAVQNAKEAHVNASSCALWFRTQPVLIYLRTKLSEREAQHRSCDEDFNWQAFGSELTQSAADLALPPLAALGLQSGSIKFVQ